MNKKSYLHNYYLSNKDNAKKDMRKYYIKNREQILKRIKITGKIWRMKNIDIIRKRARENYQKNGYKRKEYFKSYYMDEKNKERHKKSLARNYQKNKYNLFKKERIRVKIDKNFAIKKRLRCLLRYALKNYGMGKQYNSSKYGVDYNLIIQHLKPFPEDITKYHIDHIKPLCLFNLINHEQVKIAFAPENHQWLLAEDNLKKGAKIEWQNSYCI